MYDCCDKIITYLLIKRFGLKLNFAGAYCVLIHTGHKCDMYYVVL